MERPATRASDALEAIRSRWRLALLVALGITLSVGLYVSSIPNAYTGVVVVGVGPRSPAVVPAADFVSLATSRYVAYATAPSTLLRLAGTLDQPPGPFTDSVSATVASGTSNIVISVTLPSAPRAAQAANAVAGAVTEYSATDPILEATVVAPAVIPDGPSSPLRKLDILAGVLAGLLVGAVVVYVVESRRPRVRQVRQLWELSPHAVLGLIPPRPKPGLNPTEDGDGTDAATHMVFMNFKRSADPSTGIFVVTSPSHNADKARVAHALSDQIAAEGARTLFLDADRAKTEASGIGTGDAAGTDGVARGHAVPDADEPTTVDFLVQDADALAHGIGVNGGTLAVSTTDARGAPIGLLEDRLRRARQEFDTVIVNAPSMRDGGSGFTVLSDGVVLVVPAGTAAAEVEDALMFLDGDQVPVVGLVGFGLR